MKMDRKQICMNMLLKFKEGNTSNKSNNRFVTKICDLGYNVNSLLVVKTTFGIFNNTESYRFTKIDLLESWFLMIYLEVQQFGIYYIISK